MFVDDNLNFNGNYEINLSGDTFFYVNTGTFAINGNVNFQTDPTRSTLIYLKQGSFDVNGNQSLTAKGITFYLENGDFKWNGNADLNLEAPTDENSPYKGLLVYLPETNKGSVTINGNSKTKTVGTILAPGSHFKLAGNSDLVTYRSQIICYTMDIQGNFTGTIDFRHDENWQVEGDPFIELPH